MASRPSRLVSYAASFGNHSAWDGIDPEWAASSIVSRRFRCATKTAGIWSAAAPAAKPEIVLDPCLQFPPVERRAPVEDGLMRSSTATASRAGSNARVRRWADRTGMRLVSIGYSNDCADEQRIGAGPLEFARLMAGASAVITNFFHGCVFALLNGKPWATAPSDYRSIKIPDLAAHARREHRLVDEQHRRPRLA